MNISSPRRLSPQVRAEFEAAVQRHQRGEFHLAEPGYRNVLQREPEFAPCWHMLGLIRLQENQLTEALEQIGKAIALDPSQSVFFNNYGAALQRQGRSIEALAFFHRAVAIRPRYADAHSNLGKVYEELGQLALAASHYREALELSPEQPETEARYRTLAKQRGETPELMELCEELLKHQPTSELHVRMGNFLISQGKSAEAVTHYEQALNLETGCAPALFNLANAYQELHRIPEAKATFAKAAEARPLQTFWQLRVHATCPVFWNTRQEIDDYVQELQAELESWTESRPPARPQDLVNAGAFPNFSFAYLGRNVRPLKEQFGKLYQPYFQDSPPPSGSQLAGKKRLGFLVTQRHEGIFLRCMTGILQGLAQQPHEIVLFCPPASLARIRDGLVADNIRYETFPPAIENAARVIRSAACDVLYFWEVGSDSINYFLPYFRLAPVQCTSHGSQITSGHPCIDYFFSADAMELPSAQEHYSERLWRARSLLMCQPRVPPVPRRERSFFNLPSDRHLYMCLQNPLKIHPDFDEILRNLLDSDPEGQVILLRGGQPAAETLLRQRFERQMPSLSERILFLPQQHFPDYMALLQLADVVLDPLYFGWGSSVYDLFSLNQPLVTLPTALNVGRVAAACYERMQIQELIATSPADYVTKAVRLGRDAAYRDTVRGELAEATASLFDERAAVTEHARFFEEISGQVSG